MKRNLTILALSILLLGGSFLLVRSASGQAPAYALPWDVIGAGGAEVAGGEIVINATLGQPFTGNAAVEEFNIWNGFWVGLGEFLQKLFLPLFLH